MWFKIAQLCAFLAIFETIGAESNLTFKVNTPSLRVINGYVAKKDQFPHQVAVITAFSELGRALFCGGSLISKNAVLTSAQCVKTLADDGKMYKAGEAKICTGSINFSCTQPIFVRNANDIIVHPDYDFKTKKADLAIIKLPSAVKTSKSVKPIDLDYTSNQHVDAKATVAGWGRLSDRGSAPVATLRYVDLKVISNRQCQESFGSIIKDFHICTAATNANGKHVGICSGDGGDALISGGKQIGIASFSYVSCDNPRYPSGFTRVSAYKDWIKKNSSYQFVASKILLSILSIFVLLRNSF